MEITCSMLTSEQLRNFASNVTETLNLKAEIETLSDDDILSTRKELAKVLSRFTSEEKDEHKPREALRVVEDLMDTDEFWERKERVSKLVNNIGKAGYLTRHSEAGDAHAKIYEEIFAYYDELYAIPEVYDGDVKAAWIGYVDAVATYTLHMTGQFQELIFADYLLFRYWQKRQPGYEPPKKMTPEEEAANDEWFANLPSPHDEQEEDARDGYIFGLEEEKEYLLKQLDITEMLLNRAERILGGEVEATQAERDQLREDIRSQTNQKAINSTWRLADKENIRLLTQVAKPEGQSFPINYRKNTHFMRNMCLRYGIDITNRESVRFTCTRLAWANNYWGYIQNYEDKGEVIIALWVNQQNKGEADTPNFDSDDAYDYFFDAKTTLVAKQHGDKFLELERKYAPLSADFSRYSPQELLEAHKLIMAELVK